MSAPDSRNWWRLVGVAVLMALIMVPVAIMALLGLHFATWGSLLDPTSNPPLWLMVLATAMVAVLSLIPGALVGRVAGLRRGWRRTAAVMAALGGVVTASAVGWIVGAVPGLIGGSLLAVVLADRLGNGVKDLPPDADRPGPGLGGCGGIDAGSDPRRCPRAMWPGEPVPPRRRGGDPEPGPSPRQATPGQHDRRQSKAAARPRLGRRM
jgi:hypothetical protein